MATTTKDAATQSEYRFLEEAMELVRELNVLRNRLGAAQREHEALLGERESALRQGRDLLPQIGNLYELIEELPAQILQLEQRAWWIVEKGVEQINLSNIRLAGRTDAECRNELRGALKVFRPVYASVLNGAAQAASQGFLSAETVNLKLAQLEGALGTARLRRVTFRPHNLPSLDADRLSHEGVLAALDALTAQLG